MPRSRPVLIALSAMALVMMAAPGIASASSSTLRFHSTSLPGSSGFSESRVTVAPHGVRYVDTNAKDSGDEIVYRSTDGLQWAQTKGMPPQQIGPSTDVDIVSMHTGRVLASELDLVALSFRTAYSDDGGATWTPSRGTNYVDTDRQWFAVGPDDPSTHQPRVYMLFHNLVTGLVSHNMFVATSTDGGASFGPPVPVTLPPSQAWLDLQCADSGGPSNIFVNQKTGQVYVVFGTRSSPIGGCAAQPVEVNVVAATRVWVATAPAAGTSDPTQWHQSLAVDDTAAGKIVSMQLSPGAVDNAGTVYVAYPESINSYPDYDGGAIKVVHAPADLSHWSVPFTVAPSGGAGHVMPHIIAGDKGKLDFAYFTGVNQAHGEPLWYAEVAQVLDGLSSKPHVARIRLSNVVVERGTASALMGACMTGPRATLNGFFCSRAADVFGVALDSCGGVLVTWPAQEGIQELTTPLTDTTFVAQQTGGSRVTAACH
jgi:hypothetical protein